MNYRYRTDEEMKDSGIEWIGKIPKEWELSKIKYISYLKSGESISKDEYDDNGKYNIYGSNGIIGKCNKINNFKKNIIIGRVGACGEINVAEEGWISDNALILDIFSKKYNFNYVAYSLNSMKLKELSSGTAQPLITGTQIKNLSLTNLDKPIQEKIANFLDEKTSQFDSIILKKEELIKKLEEAKKSLISEVVTGKVKVIKTEEGYQLIKRKKEEMKDSEVEWLGYIPKEWRVAKLKYLVSTKITDGPHETPILVDEGIPFLSAEAIVNDKISILNKRGYITEEVYEVYAKKSRVLKGDILFCKSGSTTGKSALVMDDIKFGIWSPLAIIRANKNKINNKNLFFVIQSKYFRIQVENYWTFGTQPNIGMATLENLYVPYSEDKEQQKYIYKYLDEKSYKIDILIRKIKYQIEKLKEAKQSLISEAVTGKIEILD